MFLRYVGCGSKGASSYPMVQYKYREKDSWALSIEVLGQYSQSNKAIL